MAVGIGFDIHKLVKGRVLVLGGVRIPHPKGLHGHSDGDVVLHAVIDALLGAAGGGDIGEYFPDTDPKTRGMASEAMLKKVLQQITRDWEIESVDVNILAEEPKLGAKKGEIRENLGRLLAARVNVKAKTMNGLGPVGKGQAIAAQAVVQLSRRDKWMRL